MKEMNSLESYSTAVKDDLNVFNGELYKFQHDKIKKSSITARQALMRIIKACVAMRELIREDSKAMPAKRSKIPTEKLQQMAEKRKQTWADKKAAKEAKELKRRETLAATKSAATE